FYLCDQVLEVGGLMVFDDVWMASIRTVLAFVLANRAYQVVPQRSNRMAALRKLKDDDRDWRHFRPFAVTTRQQGGLGYPTSEIRIGRMRSRRRRSAAPEKRRWCGPALRSAPPW